MATTGAPIGIIEGGTQSGTFGLISHASGSFGLAAPGLEPAPNQSGTFGLEPAHASGTFGLQVHPYSGTFGLRHSQSGTFGLRAHQSGTFGLQQHPYSGTFGLRQGQSGEFGLHLGDRSGTFGVRLPTYSGTFGLSSDPSGVLSGTVLPPVLPYGSGGNGGLGAPPAFPPPPSLDYSGQPVSYRLGNKRHCTISGSFSGDFYKDAHGYSRCDLNGDFAPFGVVFGVTGGIQSDGSTAVGIVQINIAIPRLGSSYGSGLTYSASALLTIPAGTTNYNFSDSGTFSFDYWTELWVTVEAPYGNAGRTMIKEYICPGSTIMASANWGSASVSLSAGVNPNPYNSPARLSAAPITCNLQANAHRGAAQAFGSAYGQISADALPFNVIAQNYSGTLYGSDSRANDIQGEAHLSERSAYGMVTWLSGPGGSDTHEVTCESGVISSPLWEYAAHVALRTPTNPYPDGWQGKINTEVPAFYAPPPFTITGGAGSYNGQMNNPYSLAAGLSRLVGVAEAELAYAVFPHDPDSSYSESHNGTLSALSLTLVNPDAQAVHDATNSGHTIDLDWQGWQWDAARFGQTEMVWVDKAPVVAHWTATGGATLADSSSGLVITGEGNVSSACPLPASPDPALTDVYAGLDFRGYSTMRLYLTVPSGQTARASVSMFCLLDNEAAAYFGLTGTTIGPLTATKTWNVTVKDVATQPYVDIDLLCPSNNTASEDDEHLVRFDLGDSVVTILVHRTDMLFGVTNNPNALQIGCPDAKTYTLKQIQLVRPQNSTEQRELGGYSTLDLPTVSLPIGVSGSIPQRQFFTDTSGKRNIFNVQNSTRQLEICDFWPAPPSFLSNYTRRGLSYLSLHPYTGLFTYDSSIGHTVPNNPEIRDGLLHNSQSDFCLGGRGWVFDLNKADGSGKSAYDTDIAITGGFSQNIPLGKTIPAQFNFPILTYFPPGVGNVWNESYTGTVFPLLACCVLRTENKGYVFDRQGNRVDNQIVTVKSSPGSVSLGNANTNAKGYYFVDSSHPFAAADTVSRGSVSSPAIDRYLRWRRWTNFANPSASRNPWNYQDGWGRYHRVLVQDGNVLYWRSDFSVPLPTWKLTAIEVTSGGTDSYPRLVMNAQGFLLLVFTRTETDGSKNIYRMLSWDDGATWGDGTTAGAATMAIAGGSKSTNAVGVDGTYIEAAVVLGSPNILKGRKQGAGDLALSDLYTFIDHTGAPLTVEDDTFHLQQGRSGWAPWVLHVRIAGEDTTSDWYSSDLDAHSWTRIPAAP